MSVVHNLPF